MTELEEMTECEVLGEPEETPFRCDCPDCRALRDPGRAGRARRKGEHD